MLNTFVRKFPASATLIPIVFGIAISYFSGLNMGALPDSFFIVLLAVLAVFIIYLYKSLTKGELFIFSYWCLLVLFGLFSFQLRYFKTDDNNISNLTKDFKDKKCNIKGVIIEQSEVKDDKIRILIDAAKIDDISCQGEVLATVYKNKYKEDISSIYRYGDEIEIVGKLEPLPHQRNPGEFDYGKYLMMHNIDAVFISFGYSRIQKVGHTEQSFFKSKIIYPIKEYSITEIDKLVGGDEGEYLKGLVLGERSNISREMKENFVNAGVAHIIAVSGLNVAYVILIIWGVLIFIPIKHSYKVFITILFLLLYMSLTGNVPSIVRATIMASVFLLSQVIERKPNAYNIVSFAALVILLIDPRQLFDAGFILSFTAIFSIIIVYPVLEKCMRNFSWYRNLNRDNFFGKSIKAAITLFLGTLAAQLGTLPVTAIMFKKVSVVSLIANLFAIPLSNIALALGLIMIIFSTFSMWLASVFASVNSFLMYLQLELIEFCAKMDFAFVETYFVDTMMFVFYYIVLALVLTTGKVNYKARIAVIALLICNFVIWKSVFDMTNKAEITYIDVGNSNSTLIEMPQGTSVLINTGTSSDKYTSAERNIIPYLKTKDINELDLLIVTSLNRNELKSLKYLVENFPVRKILLPVYYQQIFENGLIAASFKNANIDFVENSMIINKQGKFRIYLYYDSLYKGESMMAELLYGEQSFLFNDSYELEEDLRNAAFLPDDLTVQVL
jgi:competence protein ComEC